MGKSQAVPRANATPPPLDLSMEILKELLDIERKRLVIAVKIEEKRDIVFPETSIIIHDIIKLSTEINKRENNERQNNFGIFEIEVL